MLGEYGFQGINDALLFLLRVLHLFDQAAVVLLENRLEELGVHAVTEVGFDDDVVRLVGLGDLGERLQGFIGVATTKATSGHQEQVAH